MIQQSMAPTYRPRPIMMPRIPTGASGQGQVSDAQLQQLIEYVLKEQGGGQAGGAGSGGMTSILGGGAGGAAGSQIAGGGAAATGGATGGGMSIGTGGGMSMAGSSGTVPAATPAIVNPYIAAAITAAAYGNNLYEGGVKDIIKGKGEAEDAANLVLDVNPVTAPINMVGRALGLKSVGRQLLGRKSTKDSQREGWGKVAEKGNDQTKAYAKQYIDYLGSDKAKEDQKISFNDKKKSGNLSYKDTWGGRGIFDLLGDDYIGKSTELQRQALNEKAIKEGLFDQVKGDIKINNIDRFKELWNESTGANLMQMPSRNNAPAPATSNMIDKITGGKSEMIKAGIVPQANVMQVPVRSSTSSPGIGKDGKRLANPNSSAKGR